MKRAAGVSLVSMLALIETAWIGLSLLFHGHLVMSSRLLRIGGETESLVGVLISVLLASAALGVLGHLPWARIVVMVLAALVLVGAVVEVWVGARGYTPFGAIFFYCDRGMAVLINGWMLWYLSRPAVRLTFQASKADWSSSH